MKYHRFDIRLLLALLALGPFSCVSITESSQITADWQLGVYDPLTNSYASNADVFIDEMYWGRTASDGSIRIKRSELNEGQHKVYARKPQGIIEGRSCYKISYPWPGQITMFPSPSGNNQLFVTLMGDYVCWSHSPIFPDPQPPECYCTDRKIGDNNCDCIASLSEVVCIINYWKAGKVPVGTAVKAINNWEQTGTKGMSLESKEQQKKQLMEYLNPR